MPCSGGESILVVEDNEAYARTIQRAFRGFSVTIAYNVPQARAEIAELDSLMLALVDLNLPGGRPFDLRAGTGGGLDLLDPLTAGFPQARVVVFTGHCTEALVRAAGPDVSFVLKGEDELQRLVSWAQKATGCFDDTCFEQWLRKAAKPHEITPRQLQVACLAASGVRRRVIATRLGISHETVKSHLRQVLVATGFRYAGDLADAYDATMPAECTGSGSVKRRSMAIGSGPISAVRVPTAYRIAGAGFDEELVTDLEGGRRLAKVDVRQG